MEGFIVGIALLAGVVLLVTWSRKNQQRQHEAMTRSSTQQKKKKKKAKKTGAPKKKSEESHDDNDDNDDNFDDDEALALARVPRQQHYIFTHQLFRNVMLSEPKTLDALRKMVVGGDSPYRGGEPTKGLSDKGIEMIAGLWKAAGKMALEMEGPRDAIPGGEPVVEAIDDGLLVRMPPPTAMTEAHFIAVVGDGDGGTARYFTLEKSLEIDQPALCEWTAATKSHVNYGNIDGTETSFLAAVRERLRE